MVGINDLTVSMDYVGLHPVRVVGLPELPPKIPEETSPGLLHEMEAAILGEIGEIVDSEGPIAEGLFDED